jgi:hypothetical protein
LFQLRPHWRQPFLQRELFTNPTDGWQEKSSQSEHFAHISLSAGIIEFAQTV